MSRGCVLVEDSINREPAALRVGGNCPLAHGASPNGAERRARMGRVSRHARLAVDLGRQLWLRGRKSLRAR